MRKKSLWLLFAAGLLGLMAFSFALVGDALPASSHSAYLGAAAHPQLACLRRECI